MTPAWLKAYFADRDSAIPLNIGATLLTVGVSYWTSGKREIVPFSATGTCVALLVSAAAIIIRVYCCLNLPTDVVLSDSIKTANPSGGPALKTDGPFEVVRHPMYVGLIMQFSAFGFACGPLQALALLAFWHLRFSALAEREEIDLEQLFGNSFVQYRRRTPFLVPRPRGFLLLLARSVAGFQPAPLLADNMRWMAWALLGYSSALATGFAAFSVAGNAVGWIFLYRDVFQKHLHKITTKK